VGADLGGAGETRPGRGRDAVPQRAERGVIGPFDLESSPEQAPAVQLHADVEGQRGHRPTLYRSRRVACRREAPGACSKRHDAAAQA